MFATRALFLASLIFLAAAVVAAESDADVSQQDIVNMQSCRMQCMSILKSVDHLNQVMTEAMKSDDPDKMRAALDKAQKFFSNAKRVHDQCLALRMQFGLFRRGICSVDDASAVEPEAPQTDKPAATARERMERER